MMRVASDQCSTCIYRADSPLDLKLLEAEIADPNMAGFFTAHRICHSFPDEAGAGPCCRGFWNRHRDRFTLGQISQRLGLVKMVTSA